MGKEMGWGDGVVLNADSISRQLSNTLSLAMLPPLVPPPSIPPPAAAAAAAAAAVAAAAVEDK